MEPKYAYVNTPEAKLLLDIINQRSPLQLKNIDLDKFIELTKLHNIIPLVFYKLKNYSRQIPQDIYSDLNSRYLANISINIKFWNEFLKINAAFKENNISILPLKGVDILTRFYLCFDLRSMCDIDILVKEEQFAEAEKILCALGYKKNLLGLKEEYWQKKQNITFCKDRITVEMHWGLDFKRGKSVILPQLWERIKQIEVGSHKIDIFSPEDAVFSLALHLRRFGNTLGLKQVFDVARIIQESPQFDWSYILQETKNGNMQASVYFILTQASLFTETHIPKEIFKELNMPYWQKRSIKEFILKYTFKTQASLKQKYLKAYFLLYDTICEPIWYLIHVPYEHFSQFYNLRPYTPKTNLLYSLRLFYMPVSLWLKRN